MRFISTLSSAHTTYSNLSDHRTVTLTNEQSLENSSKWQKKCTRKCAKLENGRVVENLNSILMDNLIKINDNGGEWSPSKVFKKL